MLAHDDWRRSVSNWQVKNLIICFKLGIIRPSSSSWASPQHMVLKKSTADWHPCGDYHTLNKSTSLITTPFPTSRILQLLYMVPQYSPNVILSRHTIKFQLNLLIYQRQLLALHLVFSNLCACLLAFAMQPSPFNDSWTRCFTVFSLVTLMWMMF